MLFSVLYKLEKDTKRVYFGFVDVDNTFTAFEEVTSCDLGCVTMASLSELEEHFSLQPMLVKSWKWN